MGTSFAYKKRLGLYGQLFDSGVGIVGVAHLPLLAVHRDLCRDQSRRSIRSASSPIMKDVLPGAIEPAIAAVPSCSAATSSRATCSAAWSMAARSC